MCFQPKHIVLTDRDMRYQGLLDYMDYYRDDECPVNRYPVGTLAHQLWVTGWEEGERLTDYGAEYYVER